MGHTQGLWAAARRGVRRFQVEDPKWRYKTFGIDFSKYKHEWVRRCVVGDGQMGPDGTTTTHYKVDSVMLIQMALNLANSLTALSIIPLFVFDGVEPVMKSETARKARKAIQDKARSDYNQATSSDDRLKHFLKFAAAEVPAAFWPGLKKALNDTKSKR